MGTGLRATWMTVAWSLPGGEWARLGCHHPERAFLDRKGQVSLGVSLDSRKTCEVLRSSSPEALLSRGPEAGDQR